MSDGTAWGGEGVEPGSATVGCGGQSAAHPDHDVPAKAVEAQSKGGVLAAKAVETHKAKVVS